MFANCVHTKNDVRLRSDPEFFSPTCNKFAVECDWNNKIPQNVEFLGFFGKVDLFFSKKNLDFIFENN